MSVLLVQMLMAVLCSATIAVLLTPLVKRLASKAGVVRAPRVRDVHSRPIPLWGGLAMVAAFYLTVLVLRPFVGEHFGVTTRPGEHPILGILLGAGLVALIGLLDDKYELSAVKQTLGLLGGGLIAALFGASIKGLTNPFAPPSASGYTFHNYIDLGWMSVPVTMLWIFLVAKTFDFLDGLDGLAAGVCAIASATMGLLAAVRGDVAVALMAGALSGACLGFLRHNYNPASIFMGTVGAQFLGFVLAALSVVGAFKIQATLAVAIPLLVLGVPVFDGLFVIAKRLWLRQDPSKPDSTSHIHHRLRNRGLSVKQTVWAIYALTAVCCTAALLLVKFGR